MQITTDSVLAQDQPLRNLDHIDLDVYCADNMRGSKEYREKLVEGLTQKLLRKVESYVG